MEFKNFSFQPEDGFLDSGFYVDSPVDSREVLQRQHNQTRDYINGVIERLNSTKEGESGAESIASPSIDGVAGENVFSQIKDIKRQLKDATTGIIPDGSISSDKLASGSVTEEKILEGSIKTEHFSEGATAPFANETYKMNGVNADNYEPVFKCASYGFFKERIRDFTYENTDGKIHKGYRYFIAENGMLKRMSLSDWSVTDYLDLSSLIVYKPVFCFDENDQLYVVINAAENGYHCFDIYKTEDGELIYTNRIKTQTSILCTAELCDILWHDGILYVAHNITYTSSDCQLYKIPCDEIYDIKEIAAFFTKVNIKSISAYKLLAVKGDLYFNRWRLKNFDPNNYSVYSWGFREYSNGKFIVFHKNIIATDENDLPVFVSFNDVSSFIGKAFFYEGYLYSVICGYLFRTRLF